MAIKLEKGQRINLEKETGAKLTNFCVGCNWGAIIKKTFFGLSTSVVDVDLDLSCMMFDANGKVVDHIWSPLYQFNGKLPQGKLDSNDRALHHTGDDLTGKLMHPNHMQGLHLDSPSIPSLPSNESNQIRFQLVDL